MALSCQSRGHGRGRDVKPYTYFRIISQSHTGRLIFVGRLGKGITTWMRCDDEAAKIPKMDAEHATSHVCM